MTYPTPYTVGWHTATTVQTGRGSTTTYTPDLDTAGSSVRVIGWAPTGTPGLSDEPSEVRVVHQIDLYVPPGVASAPGDVVDLPLDKAVGQFEVVGYSDDYSYGPFGFNPGSVIKLKRLES